MSTYDYDTDDEPGFLQRNKIGIGVGIAFLLLAGIGISFYFLAGKPSAPRKPPEIMVQLLPPPPQPPPPPPPPPPKIPPPPPKMVEQPQKPAEPKPKDVAKSPDKPPGPPGPKASGPPSDDGIGGNGGGGGGGDGGTPDPFNGYGARIQDAVHQALDRNDATRHATVHHLKVRIWIDASGRIARASISGTTGDTAVDQALAGPALTGVRMAEPPPSNMPMPVTMYIDEQRPN